MDAIILTECSNKALLKLANACIEQITINTKNTASVDLQCGKTTMLATGAENRHYKLTCSIATPV